MSSNKFRQQLLKEAEKWLEEGIINQDQYSQLAQLYQFRAINSSKFTVVLTGLGVLLFFLGIVTIVVANWQLMTREIRVTVLVTGLIAINYTGFFLMGRSPRWQALGKVFLILGALMLGVNIALVGQIFHVDGKLYTWFFVWGFGVLAMSYGLRLSSLGVVAIILIGLGYWYHFYDYWNASVEKSLVIISIAEQMLAIVIFLFVPLAYWCKSRSISILVITMTGLVYWNHLNNPTLSQKDFLIWVIVQYMPIVAVSVFLPLAYWCRSRTVFMFSIALILGGLSRSIVALNSFDVPAYLVVAIALTLAPALLWSYDDSLYYSFGISQYSNLTKPQENNLGFGIEIETKTSETDYSNRFSVQAIAHDIALIFLSAICYFQSFYLAWGWQAQDLAVSGANLRNEPTSIVNVLLFGSIASLSWFRLLISPNTSEQKSRDAITKLLGILLLIIAGSICWHAAISPIPEVATLIHNGLLFLIVAGLVRESLHKFNRLMFWTAIGLLTLQVVSRLFEYEITLISKSLVLLLYGLGAISAGLWFERYFNLVKSIPSKEENSPSSVEDTL